MLSFPIIRSTNTQKLVYLSSNTFGTPFFPEKIINPIDIFLMVLQRSRRYIRVSIGVVLFIPSLPERIMMVGFTKPPEVVLGGHKVFDTLFTWMAKHEDLVKLYNNMKFAGYSEQVCLAVVMNSMAVDVDHTNDLVDICDSLIKALRLAKSELEFALCAPSDALPVCVRRAVERINGVLEVFPDDE